MTNASSLSTAKGGEVCLGNEFSLLDVLYANQFDGEKSDPGFQEHAEKVEKNFYRGAPPEWLNFYISEQAVPNGTGSAFIKRDGYVKLVEQIEQKRKYCGISTVELFHQPGCGGTTMSMQVLWDLRKKLRCAVLTDSASDIANVANEVVEIFKAGSRNDQNTVLLLVNDNKILEHLQQSIMMTVAEQKLVIRKPVVIFLSCVRSNVDRQSGHVVLKNKLSDNEKDKFDKKKEELRRRYQDECEQFHGFNIIQSNFSQDYIRKACSVFSKVQRTKKPLKTQLVAILSLLSAYVPGSYLLESQCLDFLSHEDYEGLPLEDIMQPFSHLIITFKQDVRSEKKVRMAHTMIAQCCTELLANAGVTRSDTAINLLNNFCRDSFSLFLRGFVKDMLTKREIKREEDPIHGTDIKEEKENFSKLILDITKMERNGNHGKEGKIQSVSVLNEASKTFDRNPFFPQTLARFYYIELKDYKEAEIWAKEAKQRDPRNSFVADTLGQVYKNHLKKTVSVKPREILQLAKKAIEAFEDEEKLADDEKGPDMKEHGNARVSSFYNSRGLFGYLQVCNILYDKLFNQNKTWKGVLTKEVSMGSVLESLEDSNLFRFNNLIRSLRDGVERKYTFFKKYLNYSKPKMEKDDPEYISKDISDCYRKYVGDSTQVNAADRSVEVLSFLVEKHTQSELNYILSPSTDSEAALVNSILAPLRQKMPLHEDPPELHLLALLLHWSDNEHKCADLIQLTQQLHSSYKDKCQSYFRSRYLVPLIFIGKGKEWSRIVGRKFIEKHGKPDWRYDWKEEQIFKNSEVQALLLRIDGEVRNHRVYTTVGGKEIEIDANQRNSLWKTRSVTFHLGFTIRGPVAFGIQNKTADTGKCNGTALTNTVKETKDNEGH